MTFLAVAPGSIVPDIEVAIDFDNDPTSGTVTWTDVTPWLVSYSRGPVRGNEFDQPQAASASLKLRNDDARFTPGNASGPYYGKLKKLRRVRVRGRWSGAITNRFWGYVDDWPQAWDRAGYDPTVTITASDALKPLETFDLAGKNYAGTLSGAALAAVLADAGITARNLDPGNSQIVASGTIGVGSFAIGRVNDISATENGVVFADGGGTIQFHDRHRRIYAGTAVASGTIGDSPGAIRYRDPQPLFGDVWPIVNVTPVGAANPIIVTNAAGTASFFQRTMSFPPSGQYLVADPAEALAAAQYLSSRYSQLNTRLADVVLLGARDPSTWAAILGLDVSSLVIFQRRFLSNGTIAGTIAFSGWVEGFGDNVVIGQDWQVSVPVSPGTASTGYWILGDARWGVLGVTTIPSY